MDTRTQIMTTATAVFAEKGFANASMNDIVQASGLSKGGIYWHFKSKDEIVAAIFDQFFAEQTSTVEPIIMGDGTVSERLIGLVRFTGEALASMTTQFPTATEFYVLAARDEILHPRLEAYFTAYRDMIIHLANEAIADGDWVDVSAEDIANTIINLVEGTLLMWNLFPGHFELTHQLDTAVSLLLTGLEK